MTATKPRPKPTKPTKKPNVTDKSKLLPRLTLAFFKRPRLTALIWVAITVFGIVSYTTLLKREGFPNITIPIVVVSGTYAVNDAGKVDSALGGPVSEIALKQSGVSSVNSQSGANFFSATIQYDEKVDSAEAKRKLQAAIDADSRIPDSAKLTVGAPVFGVTGGALEKIDATISVYSNDGQKPLKELVAQAQGMASYLQQNRSSDVEKYFVADPFEQVTNPTSGQTSTVQRSFDRYGERSGNTNDFYESVIINVTAAKGADVIKLDNHIRESLAGLQKQPQPPGCVPPSAPATRHPSKIVFPNCSVYCWKA